MSNPSSSSPHADAPPVVLVHGWGGSFRTTWQRSGFTDLLADAGRTVIGVDLLGHGDAPKPHDPQDYADLTTRVVASLPDVPVDGVGFSLGAITLLRTAIAGPDRFRRLVLAGIGRNVFERDTDATQRILAALEAGDTPLDEHDNRSRLFAQYASSNGNDPAALAALMRAPASAPITEADLARVTCPVLVVVGEDDFVLPADRLVGALANASLTLLKRTDHFATPESFGFLDATLDFLDGT